MLVRAEFEQIPWRETWLTAEQVGDLLGFCPRYVNEKLAKRGSFPVAAKVGKHRVWKAGEIFDWVETSRETRRGRPRTHPSQ